MARATFEGPILSGDNRFGPLRDVGYADLAQNADLILTNTTVNTAGYGGSSGQYVSNVTIPNGNGVVYTPSATVYPPVPATITADGATAVYRGYVAYLPVGSTINDFIVDCGVIPALSGSTGTAVYISNGFNTGTTPAYGTVASVAVGRNTVTYTAAQIANIQSTTADITQGQQPSTLSQVVFNIAIAGSGMSGGPTAGKMYFTVRYTQVDGQLGSTTAYPYGNLD
jgi:hypothetical protein